MNTESCSLGGVDLGFVKKTVVHQIEILLKHNNTWSREEYKCYFVIIKSNSTVPKTFLTLSSTARKTVISQGDNECNIRQKVE